MMSYINETDFVIENKHLVYPEIVTDGLQLYYDAKGKRDTDYHRDTMLDMSGNKNHGKLHNFAYEKHSGYKDGLVFDYIDDKLVRPALNLQPNDFTFMLNGNIISFSPDGTVKRVQDGEVIESKGLNMLYELEKGTTSAPLNARISYNYAEAEWVDSEIYNTYLYNTVKYTYKDEHKYYISYKAKPDGPVNLRIYANQRYLDGDITNPILNEYNFRSGIVEGISRYSHNFNIRLWFNVSGSVIGTKVEIKDVTMIDLTETFGAGNEPTKEQMDEIIQRFGFIPNAQDLIDRIEYKGNDLGDMENIIDGLYKTEVLSSEEIYTDKADDSVVHVEVDGKSYQHAGSGKNMFNKYLLSDRSKFQLATYSSSPAIQLKPNTVYVLSASRVNPSPDGYQLVLNVMDATGGVPIYGSPEYNNRRIRAIFNMYGAHPGLDNVSYTFTTPASGLVYFSYYDNKLGESSEGNWFTDVMIDAQLEEGSVVTEYEPPVQSPDYPIKIHSLNDFDVVSQKSEGGVIDGLEVGGRNLLLNTNQEHGITSAREYMSLPYDLTPIFEEYGLDQEYTMSFDLKSKDISKYSSIQIYPNPGTIDPNRYRFPNQSFKVTTEYQRFSMTFKPTDGNKEKTTTYISVYGQYDTGNFPILRNIKLEKGNKATDWTPAPEDIAENDNHPLIDKINLLLDEPLRSVGDVKDRLFRDSDGLWKVERNVHYEILSSGTPSWHSYAGYDTDNAISTRVIRSQHTHSMSWRDIHSSHFITVDSSWAKDEAGIGYSPADGTSVWIQIPKSIANSIEEAKQWADEQVNQGTPVQIMYPLKENKYIETLSQSLQDKLNNLRSFSESNYVYTVDGNINLLDTVPLLNNHWYPSSGAQQTPVSNIGQTATQEPLSVYPGAKIHLTKETTSDNYWRIVWVDKNNNVIRRETSTANDLVLTAPNRTYGMRVSYPNGSNAVIEFDKSDISKTISENLKPTLHAKFLYNNWYKEDRVINNLMIYNRALANEEMLQNYKTIKRRWGM